MAHSVHAAFHTLQHSMRHTKQHTMKYRCDVSYGTCIMHATQVHHAYATHVCCIHVAWCVASHATCMLHGMAHGICCTHGTLHVARWGVAVSKQIGAPHGVGAVPVENAHQRGHSDGLRRVIDLSAYGLRSLPAHMSRRTRTTVRFAPCTRQLFPRVLLTCARNLLQVSVHTAITHEYGRRAHGQCTFSNRRTD